MIVLTDLDLNAAAMEKTKGHKKSSFIWKYCEAIDGFYATCNICGHKLSYKSSVTNLRKHFKKKHPEIVIPTSMLCVKKTSKIIKDSDDSEEERSENQRAASSVIVDYLRPAVEETSNRYPLTISKVQSYSKPDQNHKIESTPERYDCRRDSKRSKTSPEETEFELFGRSVVMQLKQLPLVHALELQAEITNLICQKRIQALRQSHETNTEETPMQYAFVYAAPETVTQQSVEEIPAAEPVKEVPIEENVVGTSQ